MTKINHIASEKVDIYATKILTLVMMIKNIFQCNDNDL